MVGCCGLSVIVAVIFCSFVDVAGCAGLAVVRVVSVIIGCSEVLSPGCSVVGG